MTRNRLSWALAMVFVASALWGVWLVTGTVFASDAAGLPECGGSLSAVIRQGGGGYGGEPFPGQTAFEARCVAAAHRKLELATIPGALTLVSGGALFLVRRRDPSREPVTTPPTYTFSR